MQQDPDKDSGKSVASQTADIHIYLGPIEGPLAPLRGSSRDRGLDPLVVSAV